MRFINNVLILFYTKTQGKPDQVKLDDGVKEVLILNLCASVQYRVGYGKVSGGHRYNLR